MNAVLRKLADRPRPAPAAGGRPPSWLGTARIRSSSSAGGWSASAGRPRAASLRPTTFPRDSTSSRTPSHRPRRAPRGACPRRSRVRAFALVAARSLGRLGQPSRLAATRGRSLHGAGRRRAGARPPSSGGDLLVDLAAAPGASPSPLSRSAGRSGPCRSTGLPRACGASWRTLAVSGCRRRERLQRTSSLLHFPPEGSTASFSTLRAAGPELCARFRRFDTG